MQKQLEYTTGDLYVTHVITEKPDNSQFMFHIHDRCEIYYFISGSAEYLVEGSAYPLEKGNMLIMRPGEAHRVRILNPERYERYAANFPLSLFDFFDPKRTLMEPFTGRPLGRRNLYTPPVTEEVFARMCADDLNSYSRNTVMMTSLAMIIDMIGREYGNTSPGYEEATVSDEIVGYVNAHLFDRLSVEELAAHFYLSRSQFSRVFRQATGAPPWDYIIAKRLIAAKEMIKSGASAGHAASCCGFGDYSCFYRAYVRRFGSSPAAYERQPPV